MVRGITLFNCDECGKKFISFDVEYMATAFTAPRKCPKCGSNHTMPVGIGSLFGKLNPERVIYKRIWENSDKNHPREQD